MYVVRFGYFSFGDKNTVSICYYTNISLDAVIGYFIGSIPIYGAISILCVFMLPQIAEMVSAPNTNFSGYKLRLSVLYDFLTFHY